MPDKFTDVNLNGSTTRTDAFGDLYDSNSNRVASGDDIGSRWTSNDTTSSNSVDVHPSQTGSGSQSGPGDITLISILHLLLFFIVLFIILTFLAWLYIYSVSGVNPLQLRQ